MKTLKYILPIALLTLLHSSCKKYLEANADSAQLIPSTVEDVQALLDNSGKMNENSTPAFAEVAADDLFVKDETYNGSPAPVYQWEEYFYKYPTDWAQLYSLVYTANLSLEILQKAKNSGESPATFNNAKGSALFFRGNSYLQLVWVFAKAYDAQTSASDPGIVLRTGSDFNVPSVRSAVSDAYEQVIRDLEAAADLLPAISVSKMRPSKAAAYTALARTYLSMRNYEAMYKYSDMALQIRAELMDFNNTDEVVAGPFPFSEYPYNKEVLFFSSMNNRIAVPYKSPSLSYTDTLLYAQYDQNDKRRTIFFNESNGYHKFNGSFSGNSFLLFSGMATDELYLMRAEGHARAGRVSAAMADLNKLLESRYVTGSFVPLTAATKEEALAFIFTERRKELLMRGLRWMDVKRRNKEGAGIVMTRKLNGKTYTLPPNDNRYALPLPADIVSANIPQNIR